MPAWAAAALAAIAAFYVAGGSGLKDDSVACPGDGFAALQLAPKGQRPQAFAGDPLVAARLLEDDHRSTCSAVLLTTFLSSKPDPIRGGHIPLTRSYIERYYRSVLAIPGGRARAVVLHDNLPENVTGPMTMPDGSFSFVKVDVSGIDPLLSPNDLRYLLFQEQVAQHPEWSTVFMTDGRDVTVMHNPCVLVERHPEKVFIQSEEGIPLAMSKFVGFGFTGLGGKYKEWFEQLGSGRDPSREVLNPGIVGGSRTVVLDFLAKFRAVFLDPEMALRKNADVFETAGNVINVNMAVANYVVYKDLAASIQTGLPLHSRWSLHENRTDVYFTHK